MKKCITSIHLHGSEATGQHRPGKRAAQRSHRQRIPVRISAIALSVCIAMAHAANKTVDSDEAINDGSTVNSDIGYIASTAGSSGSMLVTNTGSSWVNTGALYVGYNGTGTLTISNDGMVSNTAGYIGFNATGSGTVEVTGANSSWTSSGGLYVGNYGTGSLTISDGGTVTSGSGGSNPTTIGRYAGSSGEVTVTGTNSSWTIGDSLLIGSNGTGSLVISDGGSVSNGAGTIGSSGTVAVKGTDSIWTNSASVNISGLLTISNGGTVKSNSANVGNTTTSSTGTAIITGANSSWTTSGAFYVGYSAPGLLKILDGGTVTSTQASLGYSSGGMGTAEVTGAGSTWTINGTLYVGYSGGGVLTISEGGSVSNTSGGLIGYGSASSGGSVKVTGTGSSWTNTYLTVGYSAPGSLTISDGGKVTSTSTSESYIGRSAGVTGIVAVTGTGSIWASTANINIGENGTGTLTISDGGTVTSGGSSNLISNIGHNTGSSGAVTVTGTGSNWTNSWNLSVGGSGTGSLKILAGGTVSNLTATVGGRGTVEVNGSGSTWSDTMLSNTGLITVSAGGTVKNGSATLYAGTVTVTGTGSSMSASSLYVGESATTAQLMISDGGKVTNTGYGYIGDSAAGSGVATVTGAGSTWTSAGAFEVGHNGIGSLYISDGGTVTASSTSAVSYIGHNAGSSGAVTVTGTGSSWTNSYSLTVGGSGTGSLSILEGGTVTNQAATVGASGTVEVKGTGSTWNNTTLTNSGLITISEEGTVTNQAATVSASGTVEVKGTNSTWNNTTLSDSGLITISAGGTVKNSSTTYIGNSTASGANTLTVTGTGSSMTAGNTYVGNSVAGFLNILDGGVVSNAAAYVGYAAAGSGTVTVTGAGSTWTSTGSFEVGTSGTGSLTISGGGTVIGSSTSAISYIGHNAGSSGAVTVTGTGSSWTNSYSLTVGGSGTGSLKILDGGTVTNLVGSVGASGTVEVKGTDSTWNNTTLTDSGLITISEGGTVKNSGTTNIGYNTASGANTLTVAGTGSSMTAVTTTVGNSVAGFFNILDGGVVVSNGLGSLGEGTAGTGTAVVSGAGSSWTLTGSGNTLYVGRSGTGFLTISGGGTVSNGGGNIGNAATGSGTVTVTGANSSWTNNGDLYVGYNGTGVLTISAGGQVIDNTAQIGYIATGSGTVEVTGANSTWTNNSVLTVGFYGTGSLTISDGGTVSTSSTSTASYIGHSAGSSGAVTVTGTGSSWTNSYSLMVGSNGTGSLKILEGGTVTNQAASVDISGTVEVKGTNSTWNNTTLTDSGLITVSEGGTVKNSSTTYIGNATASGANTLTVTGTGSSMTAGNTYVGNSVAGFLNILDGGVVVSSGLGALGEGTAGTGTAMVSGAGSSWTMTGSGNTLYVGHSGAGFLTISGGGTVSNGVAYIGSNAASSGTVTVTGANSSWANSGGLYAGNNGTGTLTISEGGQVISSVFAQIGSAAAGSGTVEVTGTDSAWTIGSYLYLGSSGMGSLTISDNGTVSVNETVTVARLSGSSGTLNVASGGTLETLGLAAGSGTVSVTFDDGTLRALGSSNTFITGFAAGKFVIGAGGLILDDSGYTIATDTSILSGSGHLTKIGTGTTILAGNNTYSGGTTISAGVLQLGNGGTTGMITGDVLNEGILIFNRSDTATFAGVISGTGSLVKNGTGTTILTGENTYTGGTTINTGILQLGDGGTSGMISGAIIDNAALVFNRSDDISYDSVISGTGSLEQAGSGTTILTENNTYSGGTTISAGTLQLGNGGTTGMVSGAITNNAALVFNHSNDISYDSVISGTGRVEQAGSGVLTLSQANTYAGGTTVSAGALHLTNVQGAGTGTVTMGAGTDLELDFTGIFSNGITGDNTATADVSAGNTVTLTGNNASYAGTWNIAGTATANIASMNNIGSGSVALSGTLNVAPVSGALTFGNVLTGSGTLNVAMASNTDTFSFGSDTGSDFAGTVALGTSTFNLSSDNTTALTNATLQLDSDNTTTVGSGTQAIGNLTMSGGNLVFDGEVPPGSTTGMVSVKDLTLESGSVSIDFPTNGIANPIPGGNLLAQDDGVQLQLIAASGTVSGSASKLTLQDANGNPISAAQNIAITEGGNRVADATYGFNLSTGDHTDGLYLNYGLTVLDLVGGQTLHLATDAGASASASTLTAMVTGSGNLDIDGSLTSVTLNNENNSYTGTTTVSAGTLILGSNNALGNTSDLIINTGATADINGKTQIVGALDGAGTLAVNNGTLTISNGGTFTGVINGSAGGLLVLAGGTLTLTGDNTYTGTTKVDNTTTLQIGTGTSGSYAGDIVDNGEVVFNRTDSSIYAGAISGIGSLTQAGSGTTILTGNNTYSGGTTIVSGGTLQIGNGEASGAIIGDIVDNGTLVFNRSDIISFWGVISGTGSLMQVGSGTTILASANSYTGGTSVMAGQLTLSDAEAAGTGSVALNSDAVLNLNFTGTFDNVISGNATATANVLSGNGVTLVADNSGFAGSWNIDGTANIAAMNNIGTGSVVLTGVLNVTPASGDLMFGNVLTGSGTLNVAMASGTDAFSFGSDTGSDFAGTVALGASTFSLSGDNTTALTNATLRLDSGNTTTVGSDTQAIGNLTMNGGSLAFDGEVPPGSTTGMVSVKDLALNSGSVSIELPTNGIANPISGGNLLTQDDGVLLQLIAASGTISGGVSKLTLQDANGDPISAAQNIAITEGGTRVADATYGFNLSTGDNTDGLYLNYGLTALDLANGQTLHLAADAGATAAASTLTAKITGSGNLDIDGSLASVTLDNTNSSYSGTTTVSAGTLIVGSNNALGNTSDLIINTGATADINGKTQTVGALDGAGTLAVNNGDLTISNGGTFAGVISGSAGDLTLAGGSTLTLTGDNTYTGTTTVASTAVLQIGDGNTSGTYTGDITDNGVVVFDRSGSIVYAGIISGSGDLEQMGSGTTILTGENTYAGGTTISVGTLQVGDGGTTGMITGNVANDGILTFNRSDDISFGGVIRGTGSLTQAGSGTLTLTSANSYAGGTNVTAGALTLADADAAGTGTVALSSSTTLNLDFTGAFDNVISGNATTTANVISGSDVTLAADNSGFAGSWNINGTANIASMNNIGTGNVALAGTLNAAPASGDLMFGNVLTGSGTLNVAMAGNTDAFSFGSDTGSAFMGTVVLGTGAFDLSGDNTAALTNATLQLDSGNTTTVGAGTQAIGNLTMSGGSLAFDGEVPPGSTTGMVSVKDLTLESGSVSIDIPTNGIANPIPGGNLLSQDDGALLQLIAASGTISGSASKLTLQDANGNPISAAQNIAITEGGIKVADATYDFNLSTGDNTDGLYLNYGLTALDLANGQTLHLAADAGATAAASTLTAMITGSGNLDIDGSLASVTLNNTNSSYSGTTTVSAGTLIVGSDNALGQTSDLQLAAGTTVDLNGMNQSIGALNTAAGSVMNLNGGTLTISDAQRASGDTNGGTVYGSLAGSGQLIIDPSIVLIDGANAGLSATTTITGGSEAQLNNVQGLGTGGIELAGADDKLTFVTFNGSTASGPLSNAISGAGTVALTTNETITLTADNSGFGGVFNIGTSATLIATEAKNLGSAGVVDNGVLQIDTASDWRLQNPVVGDGLFIKSGSGTLVIDNVMHSVTTRVDSGILIVGDSQTSASPLLRSFATTPTVNAAVTIASGAMVSGMGIINDIVTNYGTIAALNALDAYSTVGASNFTLGSLSNSGSIRLAGSSVGNTLTITGNYVGNNGSLYLNTVLGGDDSATDKLVINGSTSGMTGVHVTNVGGSGAQTTDGIKVIDVAGDSNGTFTLAEHVVAGAYEYALVKNAADGGWYLQSGTSSDPQSGTQNIRAAMGVYLGNQAAAQSMLLYTLYERVGDLRNGVSGAGNGSWARFSGGYTRFEGANGILEQKTHMTRMQLGTDITSGITDNGRWQVGIMGTFAHAKTDSSSKTSEYRASGTVNGYGAGVYGTWLQEGLTGWYVDSWLQVGKFYNAIQSDGLPNEKYNAHGVFASLETGYGFMLGKSGDGTLWSLEPQAQVIVSNFSSNDYTESNGTRITDGGGSGAMGRVGVRLSGKNPDTGFQPFAEVNVWMGKPAADSIKADGTTIKSDMPGTRYQVKAGVQGNIGKNLQVWGYLGGEFGKDNYRNFQGNIGLKYQW